MSLSKNCIKHSKRALPLQECNIGYEEVAKTETIHVCSTKATRNCSVEGEQICKTVYEVGNDSVFFIRLHLHWQIRHGRDCLEFCSANLDHFHLKWKKKVLAENSIPVNKAERNLSKF
jgi:hypothetical protein